MTSTSTSTPPGWRRNACRSNAAGQKAAGRASRRQTGSRGQKGGSQGPRTPRIRPADMSRTSRAPRGAGIWIRRAYPSLRRRWSNGQGARGWLAMRRTGRVRSGRGSAGVRKTRDRLVVGELTGWANACMQTYIHRAQMRPNLQSPGRGKGIPAQTKRIDQKCMIPLAPRFSSSPPRDAFPDMRAVRPVLVGVLNLGLCR